MFQKFPRELLLYGLNYSPPSIQPPHPPSLVGHDIINFTPSFILFLCTALQIKRSLCIITHFPLCKILPKVYIFSLYFHIIYQKILEVSVERWTTHFIISTAEGLILFRSSLYYALVFMVSCCIVSCFIGLNLEENVFKTTQHSQRYFK